MVPEPLASGVAARSSRGGEFDQGTATAAPDEWTSARAPWFRVVGPFGGLDRPPGTLQIRPDAPWPDPSPRGRLSPPAGRADLFYIRMRDRRHMDYISTPEMLWTLGVDGGETTGLAWLAVPTASIYADEPPSILHHETLEIDGSLEGQCQHIGMLARKMQGHFRNPPGHDPAPTIQVEGFSLRTDVTSDSVLASPRLEAMLRYANMIGTMGASRMPPCMLPAFAGVGKNNKNGANDDRLRKWGLWAPTDHTRDATRQAIMLVRRAKTNQELRLQAWGARRL